jgi:hypothetical protein
LRKDEKIVFEFRLSNLIRHQQDLEDQMYPEHLHTYAQGRWQLSRYACRKASENYELSTAANAGRKPTVACKALCLLGRMLIAWGKYILRRLSQTYPSWDALNNSI